MIAAIMTDSSHISVTDYNLTFDQLVHFCSFGFFFTNNRRKGVAKNTTYHHEKERNEMTAVVKIFLPTILTLETIPPHAEFINATFLPIQVLFRISKGQSRHNFTAVLKKKLLCLTKKPWH